VVGLSKPKRIKTMEITMFKGYTASFILSLLLLLATAGISTTEAAEDEKSQLSDQNIELLIQELEKTKSEYESATRELQKEQQDLEKRIKQLETTKQNQEQAIRTIVGQSLTNVGSKINNFVSLGGTFEAIIGRANSLSDDRKQTYMGLNTVELDFEIKPNDWTLGSFIIEYDEGTSLVFRTLNGLDSSIDRLNIDTAFVTFGDLQRFPLALTVGKVVPPFGISTGNPVTDVLTIENPITVDAFEMRRFAIGFDVAFPTPGRAPASAPIMAPPVRPVVFKPMIDGFASLLGYKAPPVLGSTLVPITFTPDPPPFNIGTYFYDGNSDGANSDYAIATIGYRTRGNCNQIYNDPDNKGNHTFCPWSLDIDIDYNSSVFDSRFLTFEYRDFLDQIGLIPGMAASIKATIGPVSFVGEWNGAIEKATFIDDANRNVHIQPSAWQISLGYQLDWNLWVEEIGAKGTFLALSYSESSDLAGVIESNSGSDERVGFRPKQQLLLTVAEWITENTKLALEYSQVKDYATTEHGTGNSAESIYATITFSF
jgi:hypothetical protein